MTEPTQREVWACLESLEESVPGTGAKVVSEAARLAALLGGVCCGIGFCPEGTPKTAGLSRSGLRKLYLTKPASRMPPSAETYAQAVAGLAAKLNPYLVLFGATAFGAEVAARTAARLGAGLISACIDIELQSDTLVARKAVYEGTKHANMAWCGSAPYVASLDLASLEAVADGAESPVTVVEENLDLLPDRAERLSGWRTDPEQLALSEAHFVVGIGRPIIARASELPLIREAARALGAALGGSRPVIEAGVLPKEKQVGASGNWLSAGVYIACGISGSSYHMLGLREVRHLIAINNDPNAPIHKQVELSIVADLFEVLPALRRLATEQPSERSAAPGTSGQAAPCHRGEELA